HRSQPGAWKNLVVDEGGSGGALASLCFDQNAHDVALFHDEVLDPIDFHLGAGPLAEQDTVAGFDIERNQFARLVTATRTDGDDFALLRFLLGGVGNNDSACRLLVGIDALNDNTVMKRTKLHGNPS